MIGSIKRSLTLVGEYGIFIGQTLYWLIPNRLRKRQGGLPKPQTFIQLDRLAFGAVPLVMIVLFFVGMILALQLAGILILLGVVEYVPDIVAVSMVREMAPLLTGVVLSGYAGASMAAELGSMKVSEELEAMRSLMLPPPRFLFAPRFIAAGIASPLLTIFGSYVGILGGLTISQILLGIGPYRYVQRSLDALDLESVLLGLSKGLAFGLIVTSIACYQGARVSGGAVGVGRATTRAVVQSVVAIIAADLFLTVLFFQIAS